jgi:hypothetical protein
MLYFRARGCTVRLHNGMVSYVEGQVETAKLRPLSDLRHSILTLIHFNISMNLVWKPMNVLSRASTLFWRAQVH